MPGQHAQMRRYFSQVEGMVVDRAEPRFIPYRPALGACSLAEVNVFVIEEIIPIETAQLFDAGAPQKDAAARHPGDPSASTGAREVVLASGARQTEPGQGLTQGGE